MSKVICDSRRWGFVQNNFGLFGSSCYFRALCSINFLKKSSLEKKVFFSPIHQNILDNDFKRNETNTSRLFLD